jgi:hypothetical protein
MNMDKSRRIWIFRIFVLGTILGCAFSLCAALPQDTSTTSKSQSGQPTVQTEVKSATVVYVSGNDLVVKTDDGQVKHFVVPDDQTVSVDGKDLTVHDLKPGMRLTRTITTTSTPRTVTTVRTIDGTVWYVNPPSTVILTLSDGTNKQYKVPKGQMFEINGEQRDVFALRKGMKVSATVVTESQETVQASTRSVTGEAPPPPPPPETPPIIGVLLVEEPAAPPQPQQTAEARLPNTGSLVPLIGCLGLLSMGLSLGLRMLRR